MIAIKYLELSRPLEVPAGIEDREAVRFYCTWHGEVIGQVDIWHKGQPIACSQLVAEISRQLDNKILQVLFSRRFAGKDDAFHGLYRQVRARLGLETPELPAPPFSPEPVVPPNLTVSICIPSRDRPDDLRRCLERLLAHKTHVTYEIVVADNNPSSGLTEPVVREFPGVVYVKEYRAGINYARNAAALHANGEIIVNTDDDVVLTEGWLDHLIAPYADPKVMAVSGMVLPIELEHVSQYWFEVYGGLTHNYQELRFDRTFFEDPSYGSVIPLWKIGVTANQSYRAEVFADPRVGPFDNALRTTAEDLYILYRMLKNDMLVVYEPRALVLHRHRTTMEGLGRQLFTYGRGTTALQLLIAFREGDIRGLKSMPDIFHYDRDKLSSIIWHKRKFPLSLISLVMGGRQGYFYGLYDGRERFPVRMAWAEFKGHLAGPGYLVKSILVARYKLGRYTPQMFAERQRQRQPIRPIQRQIEQVEHAH